MEQVQVINKVIYNERNPISIKVRNIEKINIFLIIVVIAVVVVFKNNEVEKVFLKNFLIFNC